jgi:hypothetical protein
VVRRVVALAAMAGLASGLVTASLSAAALAQEPEVVFSTDFEDGTAQGWFSRGSSVLAVSDAQAHTGDFSLLTTGRTAGWHGPATDLLAVLRPRAVYRFEVHVQLLAGSPTAPIQTTMQFVPESTGETSWTQIAQHPEVTDQAWQLLVGEHSLPEAGFEAQFYVESPDPEVAFYIDDITITMIEPPPDDDLPTDETGMVDFGVVHQRIDGFTHRRMLDRHEHDAVDLLVALTPYQQEALRRAQGNVLTVEDVLVHKIIAWRARDRDDIESIISAGHDIDWGYVNRWVEYFGFRGRLTDIRRR